MCAVTRVVRPEAELIRFVASPDRSVVADLRAKLPGRGIWIGSERSLVERAVRKNAFARGLKSPVTPPADLAAQVSVRLREAALGRLGLARKAGAVATGFAKAEAAIAKADLAALLIAADAADEGRRKIGRALRRRPGGTAVPLVRLFSGAELSLAIGRPNVIHAAVLQGPAGKSFVEAVVRLQRYEGVGDGMASELADDRQDVTDD
jgi:predicted RNA-binding protein YlxR (DUF448 family)